MLLHEVVKHLLTHHRGELDAAGVVEVDFSESSFTPSPELAPRVALVPVVRVILYWTRQQTKRAAPVPGHWQTTSTIYGN